MVDIHDKKTQQYAGVALIILAVVIFTLTGGFSSKVDDWQFTPSNHLNGLDGLSNFFVYLAIGLIIVSLGISIYLIVIGKADKRPKRIMGIFTIVGPIGLLLIVGVIYFIAKFSSAEWILILSGLVILAYFVYGFYYAIRYQTKLGLIPLLLVPIVITGIIFFVLVSITSSSYSSLSMPNNIQKSFSMAESADSLGFAVGGAKDINNFRENINNNYMPIVTDITYEGLYYDYYFDTGIQQECEDLFCPSYSYAVTKDPFTNEEETYLQVGLNSNMKESDFERKKLNLVIVLDISGSMSSNFNKYYYDNPRGERELEKDEDADKSKMEIASESVVALLEHLNKDDRFGMVLFDNTAYVAKPMREIGDTDMSALKGHIMDLRPQGGTNMEAGIKEGTNIIEKYADADQNEYETRIIFLTDAMPNTGAIGEGSLLGMTQSNANNNIYTTFIGIGVDFNTLLIEKITKIKGANYYSVHSGSDFKKRMNEEFEYMVTPLVFDLNLKFESDGYEIEKVFGSPEANEATGEIMKVNTLFPSKSDDSGTKGGIVILKLKKISEDAELKLSTTYEDREGNKLSTVAEFMIPDEEPEYFDNTGIRKGVLLSRYASLMKTWIDDERDGIYYETYNPHKYYDYGIMIPEEKDYDSLHQWERVSMMLQVSEEYELVFKDFKDYFESEIKEIGDETLTKEVEILDKLLK